jgi:hypothetical protein
MIDELSETLNVIPERFRNSLISEFLEANESYLKSDWEKVGLKAGKICEIIYSIISGYCKNEYSAEIEKPQKNFIDSCRAFESQPKKIPDSIRLYIPRLLIAVYDIRNNRNIGHANVSILPNHTDAALLLGVVKWLMCELIRNFSNKNIDHLLLQISATINPFYWEEKDRRRILVDGLDMDEKILVHLYFANLTTSLDKLKKWMDVKNISHFKQRNLRRLHSKKMIDFDDTNKRVSLLPNGTKIVESFISKHLATQM